MPTHNEFLLKAFLFVVVVIIVRCTRSCVIINVATGDAKCLYWRVIHLQKFADEGNFQLLNEHHVKVTTDDEIAKECLITRKKILRAK